MARTDTPPTIGEPAGDRVVMISWEGPYGNGHDVPVSARTADGINVLARAFASLHGELRYEEWLKESGHKKNVMGMGASYAMHLHSTNPKEWERWKGAVVFAVRSLAGSGEKDMARMGSTDPASYFDALRAFAIEERAS